MLINIPTCGWVEADHVVAIERVGANNGFRIVMGAQANSKVHTTTDLTDDTIAAIEHVIGHDWTTVTHRNRTNWFRRSAVVGVFTELRYSTGVPVVCVALDAASNGRVLTVVELDSKLHRQLDADELANQLAHVLNDTRALTTIEL